jgi:hypothetical protein
LAAAMLVAVPAGSSKVLEAVASTITPWLLVLYGSHRRTVTGELPIAIAAAKLLLLRQPVADLSRAFSSQ